MFIYFQHTSHLTLLQGGKPVPEAVKQGVETVQDKGKKAAAKGEAGVSKVSTQKPGSPQFEAFIRRIRGGK